MLSRDKKLLAYQILIAAGLVGFLILMAPDTHAQVQEPIFTQPVRDARNSGSVSFGVNQRIGQVTTQTFVQSIETGFSYDDDEGSVVFNGFLACYNDSGYSSLDFVEATEPSISLALEDRDFPVRLLFPETVMIPAGRYCEIGIAAGSTEGLTGEIFGLGSVENVYPDGAAIGLNKGSIQDYFFNIYAGEPTDEQVFFASRIKGFSPQGTTTASTTVVMEAEYFFNSVTDFGIFDAILFDVQNLETSYQYAPIIRPITTSGNGTAIATTTLDRGVHGVVVTFYDTVLGNKGDSRYFEFTVIETETAEADDPVSRIIRNLFMPSQASLNRLTSIGTIVKEKPPIGYFYALQTYLSGVSTSTSEFNLQSTDGIKEYIFDPLRPVLGAIIGFATAIFVFVRSKKIKL